MHIEQEDGRQCVKDLVGDLVDVVNKHYSNGRTTTVEAIGALEFIKHIILNYPCDEE